MVSYSYIVEQLLLFTYFYFISFDKDKSGQKYWTLLFLFCLMTLSILLFLYFFPFQPWHSK
jgi:hypothetical protein